MDVFDLFAKLSLDTSEFDSGLSGAVSAAESLGGALTGGLATAATVGAGAVAAIDISDAISGLTSLLICKSVTVVRGPETVIFRSSVVP